MIQNQLLWEFQDSSGGWSRIWVAAAVCPERSGQCPVPVLLKGCWDGVGGKSGSDERTQPPLCSAHGPGMWTQRQTFIQVHRDTAAPLRVCALGYCGVSHSPGWLQAHCVVQDDTWTSAPPSPSPCVGFAVCTHAWFYTLLIVLAPFVEKSFPSMWVVLLKS